MNGIQEVSGSIPLISTKKKTRFLRVFFFYGMELPASAEIYLLEEKARGFLLSAGWILRQRSGSSSRGRGCHAGGSLWRPKSCLSRANRDSTKWNHTVPTIKTTISTAKKAMTEPKDMADLTWWRTGS